MAAQNGHTAVVEILVKAGADVNTVSDVGCGEVLTSRRRRVNPNTLYSLSCINARCYLPYCLVHTMCMYMLGVYNISGQHIHNFSS